MNKIASYKCSISASDLDFPGIKIQEIDKIEENSVFPHEILLWNNNYEFSNLQAFPNLKVFINWGTYKNIKNEEEMLNRNIKIEAVDYYCSETIAEYVVCLILAFERRFDSLSSGIKILGEELYGKKAGIIGLGKIGFRTAQILKSSFKCQVYYNSRKDKKIPGYNFSSLKEIFRNCDYIIISTKTRDGLESKKILKFLNKKNLIINICNDHVLPIKKILPYIGAKKIRGFISDTKYPNDKLISSYDNVWTFDRFGYFTKQSKKLKNHILNFLLKKYSLQNNNSDYIYILLGMGKQSGIH